MKPKVTKDELDKLFINYVRQVSKAYHLPKHLENQLVHLTNSQGKP